MMIHDPNQQVCCSKLCFHGGKSSSVEIDHDFSLISKFLHFDPDLQKVGLAVAMINYHLTGQPLTHSIKAGGPKALIIGQSKKMFVYSIYLFTPDLN